MQYLKPIYNFINEEALPLNVAKKYVAYGKERPKYLVDKLNELFDNQQRIYIPVPDSDFSVGETEKEVKEFLSTVGYTIKDYKLGIAFQTDNPKREIRIGKILNKEKQPELLNKFQVDINRTLAKQQTKYSIVICQHPYDVTAMTTGREWASCLEVLAGKFGHFIPEEIRSGTITVYFINSNDRNINEPRGRVNVKLYSVDEDESIHKYNIFHDDWVWIPDTRYYGAFPTEGRKVLMDWLLSNQEYENNVNYYKLDGLYNFSGTDWKVKLKTNKDESLLKVIPIKSFPDEDNEDEDYYENDGIDYNDIEYWRGAGELRGVENFLSTYTGTAGNSVLNFEADQNGISLYDVDASELVINSLSAKALFEIDTYFKISEIYDSLEFDFDGCENYTIRNYINDNLTIDGNLILRGETFISKECPQYKRMSLGGRDFREKLISSMKPKNYIELINCDRYSVKETLDVFKTEAFGLWIYVNDCPDYLQHLKSLNSIDELENYEIEFLCRVEKQNHNKENESNIYFSDMDFSGIKVYEDLREKYSEVLEIEDIFDFYDISKNILNSHILNENLFEVDSSIGISKFKYRELFDSLNLEDVQLHNDINLMKVDLSTLPKANLLRLMKVNNSNLEGLRPNSYKTINVISCMNFKSFKGLSLIDKNLVGAVTFDNLNITDWAFFDELYSIYPKYLDYLKSNVNKSNSFYRIKDEKNSVTSSLKYTVLYSDIIKHLENMSDEDWYKTEGGITEFLDVVLERGGRWEINEKGEVDVTGSIFMRAKASRLNLNGKIPVKFGKVIGNFDCSEDGLTTLENCPYVVSGNFYCSFNKLTSLEFMPRGIGGNFDCKNNLLTNLKGMEDVDLGGLNATFDCVKNQLTTLEGMTNKLLRSATLLVAGNNLTSFKGLEVLPEISTLQADENNLTSLEGIPKKINFAIFIRNQKSGKVFTMTEITKFVDIKDIWSTSNIMLY